MMLSATDLLAMHWAVGRGYPCRHCPANEGVGRGLKIRLEHAVAFFDDGRLAKLECRTDGRHTAKLAGELAELFVLCGYLAVHREAICESYAPPRVQRAGTGDVMAEY